MTLRDDRVRSALRFAITLAVTDVILVLLFGSTTATVLGSFAVISQLYFMDFDGSAGERAVGHSVAGLAGICAVVLGTVTARPLWLAIIATLLISGSLAYSRVLRGYVARAAIGLQAAFFLPLMAAPELTELPELVAAWTLGSALSVVAALVLLPHRRPGLVRAALGDWLRSAQRLTLATEGRQSTSDAQSLVQDLAQSRDRLLAIFTNSVIRPGVLGRRQWALSEMVNRARFSMPVADLIANSPPVPHAVLADRTAVAFAQAATLVTNGQVDQPLEDLPRSRHEDLEHVDRLSQAALTRHYAIRLLSIGAMTQLWLAAQTRGITAPIPDVGQLPSQTARRLLLANARWQSVWFQNALRTAIGTAVCVGLVRELDLAHGIWVVLAALTCIQGTFSAPATVRAMALIVLGSVAGVLVAGGIAASRPPEWFLPGLLVVLAAAAKWYQGSGSFMAQFLYTPMALVNLTLLSWPPERGVLEVRVEDVFLGCLVAALLTLAVFPLGVRPLLGRLQLRAEVSSIGYLNAAVDTVQHAASTTHAALPTDNLDEERRKCTDAILDYENALDTAYMQLTSSNSDLAAFELQSALARDRLTGGDVCRQLATDQRTQPQLAPVVTAFANWWRTHLLPTGS